MMNLSTLFLHALPYGLGMSAVFSIVLMGGIWYNPEIMLNDYPPDVKAAYGPARNPNTPRLARLVALLLLLAGVGILAAALVGLPRPASFVEGYLYGLVTIWTAMMTFNVVDLLVLDLPLVYFQPKQISLPGTEGMKGYSDYGFHVRGFIKGTVGITLASLGLALIPAGLWMLGG
jgi:hypothetical protein